MRLCICGKHGEEWSADVEKCRRLDFLFDSGLKRFAYAVQFGCLTGVKHGKSRKTQ